MVLLADFNVIRPDFGLLFWTTVIFLLFWLLIGKYAFRPISNALKKRENDIQSALDEAKKAKLEMQNLNQENERLLAKAVEERSAMLREAKETKNSIVSEAKEKAKEEAAKIINNAKIEIDNQRKVALATAKNEIGAMALDIAEKVIRKELKNNPDQESFVNTLVDDLNLN